jgi:aspartate aminotransferase
MQPSLRPIDLSLGDPYYSPPPEAEAAALVALRMQQWGYAPPGGLHELRELIALKLKTKKGLKVDPSQILITAGASMGLYASLAALLKPGDTVMCPDPGYPPYAVLTETLGGTPHYYQVGGGNRLQHDIAILEKNLPPSTRIIIWNSPANPGGNVATEAVTRQLVELVESRQLWLISDEVYEDLIYEGAHYSPSAFGKAERVLSLSSFSKSYALSGLRVGYIILPPSLYHLVQMTHWTAAMSPSTLSQYAALGALHASDSYLKSIRERLQVNRDAAVNILTEYNIPVPKPHGAFFLWMNIQSTGYTSQQFCHVCWKHIRVALSPGTAFGPSGEGHVRLLFARPWDELCEGIQRLGQLYQSLIPK